MTDKRLFSAPILRVLACTLGALLATTMITSGSSIYTPLNEIDRIGLPILLFPVTWVVLLVVSTLVDNIWKVWGILIALMMIHGLLIARHLSGGGA